jgi:transcriptional regulatory protein RtcR
MATLSDGGRITTDLVEEEIARTQGAAPSCAIHTDSTDLAALLGDGYETRYDAIDLVQLAYVVSICRESETMSAAAKKLYAVSRLAKKSSNDSDRLSKYLARFGLKFKQFHDGLTG